VLAAAGLACLPLLRGTRRVILASVVIAITALSAVALRGRERAREDTAAVRADRLPRPIGEKGYVSSDACRACHPEQYATWHRTYHRTMTQAASPETIVAPFDGVRLATHGQSYRLGQTGDGFWVDVGEAGDRREVVMVTGSHNQQRYWLRGQGGNALDLFPFAYLVADRRWVPGEAIFLMPPEIEAGVVPRLWNANCVTCHSVAGEPGMTTPRDAPATRAAELGIACEACHGPGAEHVRVNGDPVRRYARHFADDGDPTIVNPRRLAPARASEVCGQCHGVFRMADAWRLQGPAFRPGADLDGDRIVIRYEADPREPWKRAAAPGLPPYMDQHFWHDGTVRISGREYNGLLESRCTQRGALTCLSCHGMHGTDPDDQLKADKTDDGACSPCHDDVREQGSAHTHHAQASEGSRCYNCHMPYTTLGLLKAIRSHRIDNPSVAAGAAARPNACNLCHLDRTLAWTQEQLATWWGTPAVDLTDEQRRVSAALLWLLEGDAGQRELVAWHMGWGPAQEASGRTWTAPFLALLLDDPYAAVRYNAARALRGLPGFGALDYDYVGAEPARAAARDRVLAARPAPDRTGAALLGGADGLDRGAVTALLGRRDDRPVSLAE